MAEARRTDACEERRTFNPPRLSGGFVVGLDDLPAAD